MKFIILILKVQTSDDEPLDFVQKLIDETKRVFKNDKIYAAYDLWTYKI
jgi:hypothetical protein